MKKIRITVRESTDYMDVSQAREALRKLLEAGVVFLRVEEVEASDGK